MYLKVLLLILLSLVTTSKIEGFIPILCGQTSVSEIKDDSLDYDLVKNGLMYIINSDNNSVSLCAVDSTIFGVICIPSIVENEEGKRYIVSDIGTNYNASVFNHASKVNEVILSEGIKRIRPNSFADCHSLQAIVIPASVEIIDSYAFYNCEKLENITIEGNPIIKSSTSFFNTLWMKKQPAGALILAGNLVWYRGGTPRNYVTPEGVFNICSDAFQNGFFSNIVVNEGVKYIQPNAFYATNTIKLPLTLKSLPLNIFVNPESNSQIDSLYIPRNVSELLLFDSRENIVSYKFRQVCIDPANEFFNSPTNSNVIIRNSDSTLIIAGFKDPIIPIGVKRIGTYSFLHQDITSIDIPNSVLEVSDCAFKGCLKLERVNMPDSIFSIGESAFESCHKLTQITWPEQLKYIGANAFYASGIDRLSLPNSVEMIGPRAFAHSSLESLILSDSLKYIGDYAFTNTGISEIKIPLGLSQIGNGVFSNCTKLKRINIPNNIEEVGKKAFSGCSLLETVIIEEGVRLINEYAFEECYCLEDIYDYSVEPQYVYDNSFSNYRTLHVKKKSKRSYISTGIWNRFTIKGDL